jgi:CysZ protein
METGRETATRRRPVSGPTRQKKEQPAMIIEAARLAGSNLLLPASRSVLFKSLGLTILLLIGLWFGLGEIFAVMAMPWLDELCCPDCRTGPDGRARSPRSLPGVGLALVLALFIAPVTAVMAGCFSTTSPR